jgi:hypothetical protein
MDEVTMIITALKHQIRIAINQSNLPFSITETVLDAIKGEVLNAEMESVYASLSAAKDQEKDTPEEAVVESTPEGE